MLKTIVLCAVACIVSVAPVKTKADVAFTFTQTGASYHGGGAFGGAPGPYTAYARLVLSDEAFAQGISIGADDASPDVPWGSLGVLALDFGVLTNSAFSTIQATLQDLFQYVDPRWSILGYQWRVNLRSDPRGTPTGTLSYNNGTSDFGIVLDGAVGSGSFRSDAQMACSLENCRFQGVVTGPQPVPEPSSLALLGLSLGLMAVWSARSSGRNGAPAARPA